VWSFIRNKLFSFTLVFAAAFLLLVSLLLSTAVTALAGSFTIASVLPEAVVAASIAAANFLLSAVIFAAIFNVPVVQVTWRAAAAAGISAPARSRPRLSATQPRRRQARQLSAILL
jgi:hypothetical protein